MGGLHRQNHGLFIAGLILVALTFCIVGLPAAMKYSYAQDEKSREAYIVMDANTMEIIAEKNAREKMPMASTTKIMTALIVVENCKLDALVTIPKEAVGVEGSSVYLKEGEVFSVEELLYGLMLRSGNDCAAALAIYVAGNITAFASMMNYRAEMLKLTDTHFKNPHGLHDDDHYTTAYDLCVISVAAMKNPVFKAIVGTATKRIGTGEGTRFLKNKNKILADYPGGTGVKTGYTKRAGRCLVAAAERNNREAVSVVLNCPDMWNVSKELLDLALQA